MNIYLSLSSDKHIDKYSNLSVELKKIYKNCVINIFIDELNYHTERCKPYENYLHLGMWTSVLIKTFGMFIWGFFLQFKGVLNMPTYIYSWGAIVLISMSIISYFEWKRGL